MMQDPYREWDPVKKLSPLEEKAWNLYCKETAGDMDVRDFWEELPLRVKRIYLEKASGK
jgi:hypothetical protein